MKTQLDEITLIEMEAQLGINYHAIFLSIEVKNDAIEVILCSSFFNGMDVKDRISHITKHLEEEFSDIMENYTVLIQPYDETEMNDILDQEQTYLQY